MALTLYNQFSHLQIGLLFQLNWHKQDANKCADVLFCSPVHPFLIAFYILIYISLFFCFFPGHHRKSYQALCFLSAQRVCPNEVSQVLLAKGKAEQNRHVFHCWCHSVLDFIFIFHCTVLTPAIKSSRKDSHWTHIGSHRKFCCIFQIDCNGLFSLSCEAANCVSNCYNSYEIQ